MTDSWRALREILKRRGVTITDLAAAIGVTVGTLRNLGAGGRSSNRLKRAVNDWCGEEIYPGIGISGHVMRIPPGAEIEFSESEQALAFAAECGANVTVSGKAVRFLLPTRFAVEFPTQRYRELRAANGAQINHEKEETKTT